MEIVGHRSGLRRLQLALIGALRDEADAWVDAHWAIDKDDLPSLERATARVVFHQEQQESIRGLLREQCCLVAQEEVGQ